MGKTWKRTKAMAEEICTIVDNCPRTEVLLYEEIMRNSPVGINLAFTVYHEYVMAVSDSGQSLLKSTLDYLHRTISGLTLTGSDL